jgi:hypothetical protein
MSANAIAIPRRVGPLFTLTCLSPTDDDATEDILENRFVFVFLRGCAIMLTNQSNDGVWGKDTFRTNL